MLRKKIAPDPSTAPGLFDVAENESGALDQTSLIKSAMSEAIRRSPYKRLELAFRLSTYLGTVVSEDILNQMTSAKEEYQLKASQVIAFCAAAGNWILVERMLEPQQRVLLDPHDEPALRLAEAIRKKAEAEQEMLRAQRDLARH